MNGYGDESDVAFFDTAALHRLVEVLIERGYRVVGPTLRDNAIVLAEFESGNDLPRGLGCLCPGHYRVCRRNDDAAFGHAASWPQKKSSASLRLRSAGSVSPVCSSHS
jgi:hypothetical protein